MERLTKVVLAIFLGVTSLEALPPEVLAGYLDTRALLRSDTEAPFTLDQVPLHLLTDLYLAFWGFGVVTPSMDPKNPHLTNDFNLVPLYLQDEKAIFSALNTFKKREENKCNILLSLGGWGFNDPNDPEKIGNLTYELFSKMVASSFGRKQFIASVMETLRKYELDGIDLDWEYPGDANRGGAPEDLDNYLKLLKEMRTSFDVNNPKWILSCALPATVPGGLPDKFKNQPSVFYSWISQVATHVDRITLMAYDYHGPFDSPKLTGVNAPLYRDFSPNSTLYVAYSVEQYLKNNVPKDKIVLGMPLYGRGFEGVEDLTTVDNTPEKPFTGPTRATSFTQTPGLLAYSEIEQKIEGKKFLTAPDIVTDTVRAYDIESKVWISFDNPQTLALKGELALKKELLGAIFWSIEMDSFSKKQPFPCIRSVKRVFYPGEPKP